MTTLELFLIIVFILWIFLLWTRRKYYMLALKLPGAMGYPLIGSVYRLRDKETVLYVLEAMHTLFGNCVYGWMGPVPFLAITEPQIIQDVFTSPDCVNKSFIYNRLEDITGCGLFTSKNPEWGRHRKLLNPAFGHKVLLSFMPIFNAEIEKFIQQTFEANVDGKPLNLSIILHEFTINVAIQTTMGKNITETKPTDDNTTLMQHYRFVFDTLTEILISPWLALGVVQRYLGFYKPYEQGKAEIRNFVKNLITEQLQNDANTGAVKEQPKEYRNIFINRALDLYRSGDFTLQNVEDESSVNVAAAFETTANSIYYTLMLLAMFPQYQAKVYEELKSILPESGCEEVSYEQTQAMIYLDMVINETMRLMAPVPIVARQTSSEVQLSNGITLPANHQIVINIFHLHRRADIWGPDAHIFNPDHFLPSNLADKHPYAFIPFTKGIRNCIGWRYAMLSSKVALAKCLRNYYFTTAVRFEDLHFVERVTIKLKNIPELSIHKRDS